MEQQGNRIHFRKTLYCKMIVVTLLLGVTFFLALLWIYKASCSRFEEELTYHSDTLTEQICQNVDITLKELVEKTVPLTATNERFGPLLSAVRDEDVGKEIPFQRLRIRNHLEEMLSMNDDINWMAVIDRRNEIYLAYRDSRPRNTVPGSIELLSLYLDNKENLSNRPGNVVWLTSSNEDGIVLMRSVFDTNTMQFCGSIAAEVKNTSLKAIFEHIDSSKVGNFTLYDRNGMPIYSTDIQVTGGSQDRGERESGRGRARDYLYAEYPINRGKLKIAHVIDMTEKNRRFSDLLYLISGIGFLVFLVILVSLWLMFGNMAKNLKILLDNIHRVSEGDFDLEPTLFRKGDEMDVLAFNIQEMSGRIKALMDQVVRDKEIQQQNQYQLLEFRYHELQSQVNPHFLFNILQSINGIAQINGDKQVSRLICMLSKFFRGNLERRNVSCQLREELEYSKNYLELYKDIYPDRLNIKWDVDQRFLHVRIPTYILQPIVENSLVHGMEPMIGTCTIWIRVKEEDGCLVIRIWDDGEGIEPEKLMRVMAGRDESRHIGIRNVQDRIQMLYGNEYGLSIRSEYHEYTEVKLTLPLG
ncbi:histidine kinase [Enterocloster citroniae]|uniref:histidine kinase n=1 Tax=Enterocloster citroniae TaxID=358743 RepID=UPI0008EF326C|nr:histidine kinase [Enterocloster citroniae]MCC8083558.1 histidine kinase [Clostridium sp.]SFS18726.1 HAMP domain-containing protein [Enterocloster citroniae]